MAPSQASTIVSEGAYNPGEGRGVGITWRQYENPEKTHGYVCMIVDWWEGPFEVMWLYEKEDGMACVTHISYNDERDERFVTEGEITLEGVYMEYIVDMWNKDLQVECSQEGLLSMTKRDADELEWCTDNEIEMVMGSL